MPSMRIAAAGLLTATAVAGATLMTAPTASAASYHCKTSHASVDDSSYDGPWPDNWDFTVKNCAKRSGSYVYSYAKISWDGPNWYATMDDPWIFDGAYYKLMTKRSKSGTDPVVKSRNLTGIEDRLENSTSAGNYDGTYTTPTLKTKVGKAVTDGTLYLDWRSDGRGYHASGFSASPRV